jgi:tetrahydromethanopterin S-methyltransferase subunit H
MFRFETPQKTYHLFGVPVGGQPGEHPPLVIPNMFQNKDRLLESRKPPRWDKARAADRIKELEEISEQTGVPALVGLVAPSEDEIKAYTDFFLTVTDRLAFGIDTWTEAARRQAARYVASLGVQDRFNYNSITAWDPDIPGQVQELRELGIKHIILQPFDMDDKRPSGRLKSLRQIYALVQDAGFDSILVDTCVMNLPTTGFTLIANRLVKEEFGLPVGSAPANASYMWRAALDKWGREAFRGMDAGMHAISTLLWSDWMACGPMTGIRRVFTAVAAATAVLTMLAWDEGLDLPADSRHPLNLHWQPEVEIVRGLRESRGDRARRARRTRDERGRELQPEAAP